VGRGEKVTDAGERGVKSSAKIKNAEEGCGGKGSEVNVHRQQEILDLPRYAITCVDCTHMTDV